MLIDRHHGPRPKDACPEGLEGRVFKRLTIGFTFEEHRALEQESRRRGIAVARLARMAILERRMPE